MYQLGTGTTSLLRAPSCIASMFILADHLYAMCKYITEVSQAFEAECFPTITEHQVGYGL